MTLKSYLWGMRISTLISTVGLGLVVYYIDPEKSGLAGQALFYLSMFLTFSGLFILLFTRVNRTSLLEEGDVSKNLGQNFRRGILTAFLAVVLIFFQSMRILVWWLGLLVFVGVCLIELYFLSHRE